MHGRHQLSQSTEMALFTFILTVMPKALIIGLGYQRASFYYAPSPLPLQAYAPALRHVTTYLAFAPGTSFTMYPTMEAFASTTLCEALKTSHQSLPSLHPALPLRLTCLRLSHLILISHALWMSASLHAHLLPSGLNVGSARCSPPRKQCSKLLKKSRALPICLLLSPSVVRANCSYRKLKLWASKVPTHSLPPNLAM